MKLVDGKGLTAGMISSPGEPQLPCPRIGNESASCCSLAAQRSARMASAQSEKEEDAISDFLHC